MKTRLAAVAVLTMLTVSACSGDDESAGADTGGGPSHSVETGSLGSKEADELAMESATRVVTLWARPDVPIAQWTSELRPQLSAVAMSVLSFTDPASLDPAKPEGKPRIMAGSKTRVRVEVPTTAGPYRVTMSRDTDGTNWLVDRVDSP
ncbi:hypothetical protein KV102_08300 [Mumia sp. zg.B53]|uniref:hypothetical protein n=1 Tax=unclassified Mumia TaxID=2621872 RepID=UPI001C6E371C|nr:MULTISPECIES: hypothetical protein [unclassified Mumia]MBW9207427.1 hypothetical protein [Mumia sp. zg.B17]MBW9210232.1 hypothetical protein [Mumia sp. zg.B21]MBW9214842.1 hypothetical protein [Mumia sp. zg.B53]MDD9350472.1 hypothetical protein [Mumia sp.]